MNRDTLTYLLECPESLTEAHTAALDSVLREYPYFQAARALQLKGLKAQNSFQYNGRLKEAAAHTQDRTVLFEFITGFGTEKPADKNKIAHDTVGQLDVIAPEDLSKTVEEEELKKAQDILDPGLFQPKEPVEEEQEKTPEEKLQLGRPLDFKREENHSFTEWLKITSVKPIDRTEALPPKGTKENSSRTDKNTTPQKDPELARKSKLIDRFIEKSPKIRISSGEQSSKKTSLQTTGLPPETLMTETLAKVYLEQKNYKKARQAYKILSLKYPDKSGFFADQIRAIDKLQENNN